MKRTRHTGDTGKSSDEAPSIRAAAAEARLVEMWTDPNQLPARAPSPALAASVRQRAHGYVAAAVRTTELPVEPPPLSVRTWLATRLPSVVLAGTMAGLVIAYVGWALGFVARLYLPG